MNSLLHQIKGRAIHKQVNFQKKYIEIKLEIGHNFTKYATQEERPWQIISPQQKELANLFGKMQ
jgi:hypothetical protein